MKAPCRRRHRSTGGTIVHRTLAVTTDPQFLYLTTTGRRTGAAREIEIWFTRHANRFYVIAELGERARWVQNVIAEPHVTVRVGGERFPARARVVRADAEQALVRTVQRLSEAKYGWGEGLVVELARVPDASSATT
jgi:deazaflavin-dependent oxidoreductase (nitroreductase family)